MILLALLLLISPLQEASTPAPSTQSTTTGIDPRLHADVLALLELNEVRKKMNEAAPQSLDDARPAMKRQCPKCTDEFYVEFKKRMLARNTTTLCMAATAAGYEKYLSDRDVLEMIALRKVQLAGKQVAPSDELKTKLTSVLPRMTAEIMGKCSEIGAQNGIEVAIEIAKEHPEYANGIPDSGNAK